MSENEAGKRKSEHDDRALFLPPSDADFDAFLGSLPLSLFARRINGEVCKKGEIPRMPACLLARSPSLPSTLMYYVAVRLIGFGSRGAEPRRERDDCRQIVAVRIDGCSPLSLPHRPCNQHSSSMPGCRPLATQIAPHSS